MAKTRVSDCLFFWEKRDEIAAGDGLVPQPKQVPSSYNLDHPKGDQRGLQNEGQTKCRSHGVEHDAETRSSGGQCPCHASLAQASAYCEDIVRAWGNDHQQNGCKVG